MTPRRCRRRRWSQSVIKALRRTAGPWMSLNSRLAITLYGYTVNTRLLWLQRVDQRPTICSLCDVLINTCTSRSVVINRTNKRNPVTVCPCILRLCVTRLSERIGVGSYGTLEHAPRNFQRIIFQLTSEPHKVYTVSQKVPTFKLCVTLSYLNRFSKLLHC